VLPSGYPKTTLWGYGPARAEDRHAPLIHHAPSLTIEARADEPVQVKWINDLRTTGGEFLPHLLPVDPTLHWANPAGGQKRRDTRTTFAALPRPYSGPVPLVTHLHGAHGVGEESDGYPEAWYLPDASNINPRDAKVGTWYDHFAGKARSAFGATWGPGYAVSYYPNTNRASTLWYHDHALGITRLNVYAGPAGFYLVRGGDHGDEAVLDRRTGAPAILPGPAPKEGEPAGSTVTYFEIPIVIQDRSFNADGSLFYPASRVFFDEVSHPLVGEDPATPDDPHGDMSQFPPLWNPEYFGNFLIANGRTWPFLRVQQRRYRLRLLNGCQARALILDFGSIPGADVWMIANDGGFLPKPHHISGADGQLVLGNAERADVIVDFTGVAPGDYELTNIGPDEPYGGGQPNVDFPPAQPATTGKVMRFTVGPLNGVDRSTPPRFLTLPAIEPLAKPVRTRKLALVEMMAEARTAAGEDLEGPIAGLLGHVTSAGRAKTEMWTDKVTIEVGVGDVEQWDIANFTVDAHPIHVHQVTFEVVEREGLVLSEDGESPVQPVQLDGVVSPAKPHERGRKDTVLVLPGQVTRIRAKFDVAGRFVWHCHILEHEDNEMMRPFRIGPAAPGEPRP
jgi:FtsP/CotA-like multicopper oxidase with cupredoxin domain